VTDDFTEGGPVTQVGEGQEAAGTAPPVMTFGAPTVGEILAERYQLVEHINDDSAGRQVWRGIDVVLRRPVAVVLRYPGGDSAAEMLQAAVAASRVVHPNLVGVYDAIDEADRAYVVREWVDGSSLRELVVADGLLDPDRATTIVHAVAGAVAAVHATGIVHGNIHPGTVLVAHDGRVVLTDARADDSATPETDIRSIGAILYCALTGYWPHEEAGRSSVTDGVRDDSGALASPRQVRAGVPTRLDTLTANLLNADLPLPPADQLAGELAAFGQLEDEDEEDDGAADERQAALDFDAFESAAQSPVTPKPAGRKLAVGVVGLLVLALAGTLAAAQVLGKDPSVTPTAGPSGATSSQQAKPPVGQPTELKLNANQARIVDPKGDGTERKDAGNVLDGNPATVWKTDAYNRANFGNSKDGMGVLLDLGDAKKVVSVQVRMTRHGATGELRTGASDPGGTKAGDNQLLTQFTVVGQPKADMPPSWLFVGPPEPTRYVLVWFTKLPPDVNRGGFRVSVEEITVRVE
jgi:serine/threonine protein kinase